MKIIHTLSNSRVLDINELTYDEQQYVYNGLDCAITFEVFENLKPISDNFAYNMERMMQAPAFVLSNRGIKIDMEMRGEVITSLLSQKDKCQKIFDRICWEGLGLQVNYASPKQLLNLFYEILQLKPVKVYNKLKKDHVPSTNREALEKLQEQALAKPFIDLIFEMRDLDKKKQVLELGIENDGRMHCNYNVAGTLSGRFSSSEWSLGGGGNLQNITDEMRRAFVPDEGKKFCSIDLDQAESKLVAYLCLPWGDNYLKACNSGDLHTTVAKLIWPNMPWPGTPKGDKKLAEDTIFYRHFSYRDIAKRGGHGTNYDGSASELGKRLKVAKEVMEDFQARYFRAFPEIKKWHQYVRMVLSTTRKMETPFGRFCHFPGRPWESDTIKSAIAYNPQSSIADLLNLGFYRVWRAFDPLDIQILLQVHDSILFQYEASLENEIVPKVLEKIIVPIEINGSLCRVGASAKVGFNWGNLLIEEGGEVVNPYGLTKFTGEDKRSAPAKSSMLDRKLCSVY